MCSAALPAVTQDPMDSVADQLQALQVSGGATGDREEAPVTKAEPVPKVQNLSLLRYSNPGSASQVQ